MLLVTKILCLPREKTSKEEYVGWRHNKKGKEVSRKMIEGSPQITTEPTKLTNYQGVLNTSRKDFPVL